MKQSCLISGKTKIFGLVEEVEDWDVTSQLLIIRILNVFLGALLSMEAQITNIARLTFFQLCEVRQLAPFLFLPDLPTLIHTIVTSRLFHLSSLYVVFPLRLTQKLQLLQNAAVWILICTTRTHSISAPPTSVYNADKGLLLYY